MGDKKTTSPRALWQKLPSKSSHPRTSSVDQDASEATLPVNFWSQKWRLRKQYGSCCHLLGRSNYVSSVFIIL